MNHCKDLLLAGSGERMNTHMHTYTHAHPSKMLEGINCAV